MTPTMRAAIEFFAENAGYCTPPGRMACARDLARAESEGSRRGWVVEWSPDPDCDRDWVGDGFDCACERSYKRAVFRARDGWECFCESAVLWAPGEVLIGSLGGICSADSSYRRVISAELMLDGLAGEWLESERYTSLLGRIAS